MDAQRKGLSSRPLSGKKEPVKAGATSQRGPVKGAKKLRSTKPEK